MRLWSTVVGGALNRIDHVMLAKWSGNYSDSSKFKMADASILDYVATSFPMSETFWAYITLDILYSFCENWPSRKYRPIFAT